MNKAKLLYDVVRVLKNKEKINGVLTGQLQKDQEEVFSLHNVFAKNGEDAKTTVSCQLNLDGKKVKRESSTEFSGSSTNCHGGMMRRFFQHQHHQHHQHHGAEGGGCFKGALSRISFAFGLFSSLKVEEKEGGAAVLSLNLSEIPEELQAQLIEKLNQRAACHPHCGVLEGCHTLETLSGLLLLTVTKEREIETAALHLESRVVNEKSEPHALTATANVQFAW
jgi:hypothetical protein